MRDFELERYFSKWEFAAQYPMAGSDMQSMSLADLLSLASDEDRQNFDNLWLGYTETFGAPLLREEIAATYSGLTARDILCFAGAEEGVYIAMRCLLTAKDHAIVVVPNYQSAETIPLQICEVTGIALELKYDDSDSQADGVWQLDIGKIKSAIKHNTRVISINFPNNPTGAMLGRKEFSELVGLCEEYGIYLFSDEVYRLTEQSISMRLPQAAEIYSRGLSLNVMSKAYGLPGLRIGWIACQDHDLLIRMERYKHYLSICNSAPSEQLALIALRAKDQILAHNKTLLDTNRAMMDGFFNRYKPFFRWRPPPASCVAFPRYVGPGDADTFCDQLVEQTGVLLLPPRVYQSELLPTPKDRFRVGYGRRDLQDSLRVFAQHLEQNG